MEIRALRERDDRTGFRSGDVDLDRFFVRYAGQNQFRHHIGTTYVALDDDGAGDGEHILGYATVAAGQIEGENLPSVLRRRLPGYPLPALRLARLAVEATAQDRGVGRTLLRHVFALALDMADRFGCVGVVVDAKPDAVDYYSRFGFSPLEVIVGHMESRPEPQPMFLPLALVAAALKPTGR